MTTRTAQLKRALRVARRDPVDFVSRVRQRMDVARQPTAVPTVRGRSIEHAALEIATLAPSSVAIVGDRSFFDAMRAAMPSVGHVDWLSHSAPDVAAGSGRVDGQSLLGIDVVVAGGSGLATSWRSLLRAAYGTPHARLLWVADDWEFAGSRLPIPSDVEDVEFHLHHHFGTYFGVKDHLYVRRRTWSPSAEVSDSFIIAPDESITWTLRSSIEGPGPFLVEIECDHPRLTAGRHQRWRMAADVHHRGSEATLHASHDYEPVRHIEARRPGDDLKAGSLALMLPRVGDADSERAVTLVGTSSPHAERGDGRLTEVTIERGAGAGACWGYELTGSGTPYIYRFDEVRGLSANHEVSVPIRSRRTAAGTARALVERNARLGLHPHLHPIPLPRQSPIEFGVSMSATNPELRHVVIGTPTRNGVRWDSVATPGRPVTGRELLAQVGGEPAGSDLTTVLVGPAYLDDGLDPQDLTVVFDLFARHTSGDEDFTEFQSCWRNVGLDAPEHPHWLVPAYAVVGRTNVLMRFRRDDGHRTGVVITNASGWEGYATQATATVAIVDPGGASTSYRVHLAPWESVLTWPEDELADAPATGTIRVTCVDADLNCQVVTTGSRFVTLQHMWGY